MKTAKKQRLKWSRVRAQLESDRNAGGVSEREQIEASLVHRPLRGAQAAVNAQLQTPEAWRAVWADQRVERGGRR